MPVKIVVGAQWGDEGKGKIVDYLAGQSQMVMRFQGGPNAGHTIVNDYGEFKLHSVPSGIFQKDVDCLIGAGTVLSPPQFFQETGELEAAGVALGRLMISDRAHLIMPWHAVIEEVQEESLGKNRIGTTRKAIGPTYADRFGRWGISVGELLHRDWLRARLADILKLKNQELEACGKPTFLVDDIMDLCQRWTDRLRPFIRDTVPVVHEALNRNDTILLEGQLGIGKGAIWGSYPFVTSSSPIAGGGPIGAGIPPHRITDVIGIVKAYSTSVGAGPMVTLDEDEVGPRLRELGHEFGATTGRPRKCGWLDAVMLKYGAYINGYTTVAVTRLDILDSLETIGICTAYETPDGNIIKDMPLTPVLMNCKPIFEYVPGWQAPTSHCRSWEELPEPARNYVERIEQIIGTKAGFVSVGPRREETILR